MLLDVSQITGDYAIDIESGQKLHDATFPLLLAGDSVELDFSRVRVVSSAFFNYAVGQLMSRLSPGVLNELLSFKALNGGDLRVLQRVVNNAKQYYNLGRAIE